MRHWRANTHPSNDSGAAWQTALELIAAMQADDIPRDTITYNTAISACEKSKQWTLVFRARDKSRKADQTPIHDMSAQQPHSLTS